MLRLMNLKKNKNEILRFLETHTWKETSEFFKVSEMTISRWLKQNPTQLSGKNALKKLLSWKNKTVQKYAKIIKQEIGW